MILFNELVGLAESGSKILLVTDDLGEAHAILDGLSESGGRNVYRCGWTGMLGGRGFDYIYLRPKSTMDRHDLEWLTHVTCRFNCGAKPVFRILK